MSRDRENERYLGDGLYVHRDRFGTIWLRAPRDTIDHVVALEPEVLEEFQRWLTETTA